MKSSVFILSCLAVGTAVSWGWADMGKALINGTKEGLLVSGTVSLEDTPSGLKIDADINQAPAGVHAFHIHEFGSCNDEGKAAGSHYNPAGHPHGNGLKDGISKTHAGDFGNITVDAAGKGALHTVVAGLSLTRGEASVAGRTFVLHEKVDDFSQPTGNAGSRIGCGPILITGK